MSVFKILRQIETRPGMYLGYDPRDKAAQLRILESVLYGYSLALLENEVEEPGLGFLRGLGEYMKSQGWRVGAIGPIATILSESEDPEAAWQTFWRLVWEYEATLGGA